MQILLSIIALCVIVSYAYILYKSEIAKAMEGEEVGYMDYYYCSPTDVVILTRLHERINEGICFDYKRYLELK